MQLMPKIFRRYVKRVHCRTYRNPFAFRGVASVEAVHPLSHCSMHDPLLEHGCAQIFNLRKCKTRSSWMPAP